MSTFKAEVVRAKIEPHPNAERLELAKVKGWQCVVGKGSFQDDTLAVYIPVESILPDSLIDSLGIRKNYHGHLRTIKLRGYISQGVLAPLSVLPACPETNELAPAFLKSWQEGDDVTSLLGITKYEAPIPVYMAGLVRSPHPAFIKYTGIENIKNFPLVFTPGEEVVITEKIHGTNFRAAMIDGDLHVGSHGQSLQEVDGQNLYWRAANLLGLRSKLKDGEQVFGEVYGAGVQDLSYGAKPGEIKVRLFDLFKDSKYSDHDEFVSWLTDRGLQDSSVPLLYRGPWSVDMGTTADGKSTLSPEQIREGIVVKPVRERWDAQVGRVVLKIVSDAYLTRRDATEHH